MNKTIKFRIKMSKKQKQLSQTESISKLYKKQENNPLFQSFAIELPKIKKTDLKDSKKDFSAYENGAKIINQLPQLIFSEDKIKKLQDRTPKQSSNEFFHSNKPAVSPFFIRYISRSEQKRKKIQIKRQKSSDIRSNFTEIPIVSFSNLKLQKYKSLKLSNTHSKFVSPKFQTFSNKSRQVSSKQEMKIHQQNCRPQIIANQELNILKKSIILMSKSPKSQKKNIFKSLQKRRHKSESIDEEKLTPWSSLKDCDHYF